MATKKIEVSEDDLKKIVLILKQSKEFVNIPPDNLTLQNLWRVAPKLSEKLMKKAGLVLTDVKGRMVLKQEPVPSEKKVEEATDNVTETPTEETKSPEVPTEEVTPKVKVPRCRKRKH